MVTLCFVCKGDAKSFSKVTVTFIFQNAALTQYVDLAQFLFLLCYSSCLFTLKLFQWNRGKSDSSSPSHFPKPPFKDKAKLTRCRNFANDVFVSEKCLMLTRRRRPRACYHVRECPRYTTYMTATAGLGEK